MNCMARNLFKVTIGRPYNKGAGCGAIYDDINNALSPNDGISDNHCEDSKTEGTFLTFTVASGRYPNIGIIDGLQKVSSTLGCCCSLKDVLCLENDLCSENMMLTRDLGLSGCSIPEGADLFGRRCRGTKLLATTSPSSQAPGPQ